jgi:purine-binding chemotaxis protein CheW
MSESMRAVVFGLDGQRYALPLAAVRRIVRAAEVTPLPGAPAIVLGAIDVEGSVIPVLDIRRRFLLPERELSPADQFLIASTVRRAVALVIDEAHGVIEREQSAIIGSDRITPGLEQFKGVVQLEDGLVLIHDLEKFLSLDEARVLDEAMDRTSAAEQPE